MFASVYAQVSQVVPDPIRRSRHSAPVRFIFLHLVLVGVVNLVLFAGGAFQWLASATSGLVTGSWVANLVFLGVLVAWLIVRQGDLRLYDIGVIPSRIPAALVFTLGLWLAAQTLHAVAGLLTYGSITVASIWNSDGMFVLLGMLLAQLFGNALFEEIAFRGFLFPQVYLRLDFMHRYGWFRLIAALILTQGMFALTHIPNRIYLGLSREAILWDLGVLFVLGVLFTFIYARTDNLFIVVGIHALGNAPTTLFRTAPVLATEGGSILIYSLVIAGVYGVPWWWARRTRRIAALRVVESLSEDTSAYHNSLPPADSLSEGAA